MPSLGVPSLDMGYIAETVDEHGVPFDSFLPEGRTQGDSLGPFFFTVGYHMALLETQPGGAPRCD